jgi:hypothetical protein
MTVPEFTPEEYKKLKPEHAHLEGGELTDAMQDYIVSRTMNADMQGLSFHENEIRFISEAIARHLHYTKRFIDEAPAEVNGKPVTEEIRQQGRRYLATGINAQKKFIELTEGLSIGGYENESDNEE